MFHQRNRIVLAAGIAVTVIAAMAGPASARVSAAAAPSAAASTPVPVDITGDITWTENDTENGGAALTVADKRTGTFHIDLTNVTNGGQAAGGDSSTYSFTDNYSASSQYAVVGGFCSTTTTGSFTGSGSLLYPNGGIYVNFDPSMTAITVYIGIPFTEEQTVTNSGPPGACDNGTTTNPVGLTSGVGCVPGMGQFLWPNGSLNGAYPNATVNVGCSEIYAIPIPPVSGSSSVTGTLTITPSCGGGATASPAGLCITSPPDNSKIAISDPQFVDGAQIGANDRAPALSALKLKVSGTSTCPGSVTVNGVAATSSGDEWTAEIPLMALAVGGVGQVTLTATAAGCSDASSTVTLINLEITNPAENASEPITNSPGTGAPVMPSLHATPSVVGYSGDTSGVSFDWTLNARGETVARPANWSGYSVTTTGSTTGTGEAWQPSYDHIVGGVGWLEVQASLPGVMDNPVTSFPRWFNIPGTNPDAAIAKSFVDQADPAYADPIRHLVCIESAWHQFNTSTFNPGNNGQPAIPNVPADWTPNPGVGQPLFGPPAGIGIAQLDPASLFSPDQYWDWQTSLKGGIALFHAKLQQAQTWANREQARLISRLAAALAQANATRKTNGLPTITMQAITVPPLTDEQAILQAIRYYNGGNEFHFDADYVLSKNNIDVNLVGSGQWVGGSDPALDGVQPSKAGFWGHASTDLHLSQPWVALAPQFHGYVKAVLKCKNS